MKKTYNVAVVGATGAVGTKMLETLEKRNFPINTLKVLASKRSVGNTVEFKGESYVIEEATPESFEGVDIALFSAGGSVSEKLAPEAAKRGAVAIDNTSFFRMHPDVPLVVPEVNPQDIQKHKGIIANPNCSTIQMLVALKSIHDTYKIKRIIVSTYQAVSGTGYKAIEELTHQTEEILSGFPVEAKVYPHQIAFNVLPQIDVFEENGFTKEEMKMINETQKIFGDNSIEVTATCVRVPVLHGHSESVYIETEKPFELSDVREILSNSEGVKVVDNLEKLEYPLPIHAAGQGDTFVGRIRKDLYHPNGLNMWVVSDNLLKGAALNAVQIAEKLINEK
ncbi:aspartate-semialdehyde dehydrogenase [Bacillus cereus]